MSYLKHTGFVTIVKRNPPKSMAYKTPKKVTPKQVYSFIVQYEKRYQMLPSAGVIASFYKVSKQTVYTRLNELEEEGKIKRIMVVHHATTYSLK